MTNDPDKQQDPAQKRSEWHFDPFTREEDMFKVVLWAGGAVVAIILLVVLARVVF